MGREMWLTASNGKDRVRQRIKELDCPACKQKVYAENGIYVLSDGTVVEPFYCTRCSLKLGTEMHQVL